MDLCDGFQPGRHTAGDGGGGRGRLPNPPLGRGQRQGPGHAAGASPDGAGAGLRRGRPGGVFRRRRRDGPAVGRGAWRAVTGSDDKSVWLWESATGKALGPALVDPYPTRTVAVSPDGRTVLKGGLRGASRLWDVATRKPVGVPLAHRGAVLAAA